MNKLPIPHKLQCQLLASILKYSNAARITQAKIKAGKPAQHALLTDWINNIEGAAEALKWGILPPRFNEEFDEEQADSARALIFEDGCKSSDDYDELLTKRCAKVRRFADWMELEIRKGGEACHFVDNWQEINLVMLSALVKSVDYESNPGSHGAAAIRILSKVDEFLANGQNAQQSEVAKGGE